MPHCAWRSQRTFLESWFLLSCGLQGWNSDLGLGGSHFYLLCHSSFPKNLTLKNETIPIKEALITPLKEARNHYSALMFYTVTIPRSPYKQPCATHLSSQQWGSRGKRTGTSSASALSAKLRDASSRPAQTPYQKRNNFKSDRLAYSTSIKFSVYNHVRYTSEFPYANSTIRYA